MSEVHLDFAFLGREEDRQRTMAVLVVKERTSKMIMSAAVPRKTTGAYIAKGVVGFFFARSRMSARRHGREERPRARPIVEDLARL